MATAVYIHITDTHLTVAIIASKPIEVGESKGTTATYNSHDNIKLKWYN